MGSAGAPGSPGSSGPAAARPAAALLQKVRETGIGSAMTLFKHALDSADDALFKFSEKSDSAAERGRFMDAMRSMRLGRPTIEGTFRDHLANRFLEFQHSGGKAKPAGAQEIESDSLSLVDENDLEEDLAVNGMISKAVVRHHSALYALHQRLAAVLAVKEVDADTNPLGPAAICQALRAVARQIEADVTIKLVIFKIFDRHVVVDLDQLYEDVNRVLSDAGVLPHIKFTRPPRVAGDAAPAKPDEDGESHAGEGKAAGKASGSAGGAAGSPGSLAEVAGADEVVAALAQLLSSRRESARAGIVPAGPAVAAGEVLGALARMQSSVPVIADGTDAQSLLARVERVKQELIEQLRGAGIEQAEHRVAGADEDAIDLVGMLFQFVVQDRNLPAEIQALLSRLQIPYVRVAVKDKHLFAQREHPARQLLDAMAIASIGWTREADRDGRFLALLEHVVRRVTTEYTDDLNLFTELEGEFLAVIDKQKKQTEAAESRANEAALGREKLAQARRAATGVVAARLARRELPPLAREVLLGPWTNFLVLTHLRQGPESAEWKGAVNFIDAVIWGALPKSQDKDVERLRAMLPQMQGFLRHGLGTVGFADHDANRLVAGFGALYRSLHSREVALDQAEAIGAAERSLATAAPPPVGAAAHASGEIETVVDALPDDDEYLVRVRALKVGTWVEFSADGAAPERAKISWISPVSARLLFVNRKGLKVAERSVYTLANELREGIAQILEVAPIFERALNSIMNRLKYEHLLASGARPNATLADAQAG